MVIFMVMRMAAQETDHLLGNVDRTGGFCLNIFSWTGLYSMGRKNLATRLL